jgi:hypothetical protein
MSPCQWICTHDNRIAVGNGVFYGFLSEAVSGEIRPMNGQKSKE